MAKAIIEITDLGSDGENAEVNFSISFERDDGEQGVDDNSMAHRSAIHMMRYAMDEGGLNE